MTKRIVSVLLCFAMCMSFLPAFAVEKPITVEIDGRQIEFDTAPVMINDRVMLPIRAIFEAVGATVEWDDSLQSVTAVMDGTVVEFSVGESTALVNGVSTDMYGGAVLIDSRTLVSARFIGEAFGLDVSWDENSNKVIIESAKKKDHGHSYKIVCVTASNDDGNKPENVNDDNYATRWSSDHDGAELFLELEDVVPVGYIGIAAYKGDERQTSIAVDVSEDGVHYTEVVTKMLTTATLAMEPISFGGVYNARFVRIRGYGNTDSFWNSITEVNVYAPQEDGSMPVDPNGPGSSTVTYDELPERVRNALMVVDEYYEEIPTWLANMYDSESGGFFAAMSGKDDPSIDTSIEVTSWGINTIRIYLDCWLTIPEKIREHFINFFNERQDPETGMYIDKQGPVNDRETARTNAAALGSMSSLRASTLYPHPRHTASTEAGSEAAAAVMPAYMASVDSYINWVESMNWDTGSWTAADQTQQSLVYIDMLPEAQAEEYATALFEWLENRQDPETGLWGKEINFNSVSGAYKVGMIYLPYNKQLPNPERIINSIFKSYEIDSSENIYYVRNPLSVLEQMKGYSPEIKEMIQEGVLENIDNISASIARFYCPDGAFSAYPKVALTKFGGVVTSHGLYEGDIDATYMALLARSAVYTIFDAITPKIKAPDLWNQMLGNKEIPSPYKDSSVLESGGTPNEFDFENFVSGTKLKGSELGLADASSGMELSIVDDIDLKNNKVLKLSYDGSLSTGPSVKINNGQPPVKFRPRNGVSSVAEFKIKFEGNTSVNNIYINFGSAPAFALSFGGNGNQKMSSRVDTTNVAYGGTITSLKQNEWYEIRAEYTIDDSGNNATIKLFVDGELIGTNSNYNGAHLGQKPVTMGNQLSVTYYKAGNGNVYLDDIKVYEE